jgi:hypothetical protein
LAPAPPISPDHVFVNCPFDDEYTETFRALIFAIRACGFQPRSARELDDSGQPRIEKLYGLIKECRYGGMLFTYGRRSPTPREVRVASRGQTVQSSYPCDSVQPSDDA